MMDYEVFKNVVAARIKEFLPPLYESFDQHVHEVPKINGVKDALILDMEMTDKRLTAPNIYLDDLYEEFKLSGDLDKVLEEAAMMIVNFTGTQPMGSALNDVIKYKQDIVKALVNTARNRDLLAAAPHSEFMDLSVIYRLVVEDVDNGGYATALVTSDIQQELDLSDEELDELAEENTNRKLKTKVMTLSDDVMVMTMEQVIYGAVNLMRKDKIRELAEHMNDDLYLIAGSMHEIIAVKSSSRHRDEIVEAMRKGDTEPALQDEFLSDSVYFYELKTDSLCRLSEKI